MGGSLGGSARKKPWCKVVFANVRMGGTRIIVWQSSLVKLCHGYIETYGGRSMLHEGRNDRILAAHTIVLFGRRLRLKVLSCSYIRALTFRARAQHSTCFGGLRRATTLTEVLEQWSSYSASWYRVLGSFCFREHANSAATIETRSVSMQNGKCQS
jgi:hypothetical protein